MVMEGNEYGHSVTLAAVPVSAFKCALSLSLSVLCPLVAVVCSKNRIHRGFSCAPAVPSAHDQPQSLI